MKGLFSLLVLALASFLGHNSCNGRVSLNPFPLGTIGCLISDVCGSGEVCANDNLFGSCQNIFTRALTGEPRFKLEEDEIVRLGKAITVLVKAGFTWKDAFTQCTLQNTLVEFARRRLFDPNFCKEALSLSSEDLNESINDEIAAVLLNLLDSGAIRYIDDEEGQENPEFDGFNSNKRDEIVQVHKYFDKSKGQLKRDPYEAIQSDSPYQYFYPQVNGDSDDESERGDTSYLDPQSLYNSKLLSNVENGEYPVFATDTSENDNAISESDIDPLSIPPSEDALEIQSDQEAPEAMADSYQSQEDGEGDDLNLTPEDEETLEQLIDGSIQPEYLDKVQQKRLQRIIEGLITLLDNKVQPIDDDSILVEEKPEFVPSPYDEENLASNDIDGTEEVDPGDDNLPVVEDKRDNSDDSQPSQSDDIEAEKMAVLNPDGTDDQGLGDDDGYETPSDIKNSHEPIDTHSMYMLLSREVDTPTGILFVHNFTEILGLPAGMIGFIEVGPGNLINLEIRKDPTKKWDAEKIADKALQVKNKLQAETGIFVIKAGIGREDNGVEVKQSNRNIVLTFILVGSIAGVVLAVLTIYLIKRHAKFKQKLAQMASNPDGNEASKDYQDLCRQRMQGKSSEKPEPLHAASRIGSVSESQVRSPSSRSSTSSWSEEPAATNMDISTGHIVLSYMEDHLKNQDRLDKEWEAVSSYSADPSSTKVATDQSNTRKNRFADILPYDHSRVVLSSNANVANSDYINANFITDHDPRNPAYICTQGPLPHTVADFWQMIWEQGSVVIVMLTKLAENGTSLCHRYWPEEGSDLYHIYEVHLVSEHIWCDDYLVRSFYLKNLQTNETRTVTQFHFLTWPQLSVPASIKALLDFRRKVNKSFRGRSCPIVVHCSDGCGRSGTYCLIDMVLNKMAKGAKEIDMAATLEHIRDQRMSMVKTKEQFQFSLAAVAEEVHAILKALPQ